MYKGWRRFPRATKPAHPLFAATVVVRHAAKERESCCCCCLLPLVVRSVVAGVVCRDAGFAFLFFSSGESFVFDFFSALVLIFFFEEALFRREVCCLSREFSEDGFWRAPWCADIVILTWDIVYLYTTVESDFEDCQFGSNKLVSGYLEWLKSWKFHQLSTNGLYDYVFWCPCFSFFPIWPGNISTCSIFHEGALFSPLAR